jgi:predicted phosphodiesterase
MKILTALVPSSCDVVLFGDTGDVMQHEDGVRQVIDFIASGEDRRAIHMGDEINAIVTDDKRYQSDTTKNPIPVKQMLAAVEQYKPIRSKILCWLKGNHTDKLHRFGNLTELMCRPEHLDVPYGTWSARLELADENGPFAKMFLMHGGAFTLSSNAKDYEQRMANMKASLKMRMVHKAGDCVVMACGHTHKLMVVEPARKLFLVTDDGKLKQRYTFPAMQADGYINPDSRWYVNTGSFLRLYQDGVDGYAERLGLDPVELGYAVVEIRDRKVAGVRRVVIGQ